METVYCTMTTLFIITSILKIFNIVCLSFLLGVKVVGLLLMIFQKYSKEESGKGLFG